MLDYPIYCIFKTLYVDIIFSYSSSAVLDKLLHLLLSFTQFIHRKTELRVDSVENTKLVVHLICLFR